MKIMITGGVKSGKSFKALELAGTFPGAQKYFLATAECMDGEMEDRIRRHREERGDAFITLEEPVYIDRAVTENIVLDCVTMWVNNILYHHKEAEWEQILTRFLNGLGQNAVFVTNETGLGNIPADSLSRRYNRFLGEANRRIAASADRVIFMVSGIPMRIK